MCRRTLCGAGTARGPFRPAATHGVDCRGHRVWQGRPDLLVVEGPLVELKAMDRIAPIHNTQVISYLKATRLHLGFLINLNVPLRNDAVRRFIWSRTE